MSEFGSIRSDESLITACLQQIQGVVLVVVVVVVVVVVAVFCSCHHTF